MICYVDLKGVDLSGLYLYEADLTKLDLRDVDLSNSHLYKCNLSGANLEGADLTNTNFTGSILENTNLSYANLTNGKLTNTRLISSNFIRANLHAADLRYSVCVDCTFTTANMEGADFYKAVFVNSIFSTAILKGVSCKGTVFSNSRLQTASDIPSLLAARCSILPAGDIIGWKKCKYGKIVKLLIPAHAERSNATGRKCRASEAKVLAIYAPYEGEVDFATSIYSSAFIYRVGEIVKPVTWNTSRWSECGGGIHFYLTREEAEAHV